PSGRWQTRYSAPATGRLRTAPHTFATTTEAGRWLSVLEADSLRGVWVDPREGDMRFAELAERWFATKIHLRETTKLQYHYLLKKHLLPFFGERPIGSITVLDVQTWLADRQANTSLCANSVAKAYKVLRMVMETAVEAGLILRTPCRVKGAATERLPEMRAATPEQVAEITSNVEPRWQALILMAAYSGLRWGERAGLRQKHLDPLHKKVRVVEQLLEVNGRLIFSAPKTAAGVRTVALPPFLVEVMVDHVARYGQPGADGLVFVMPEGTPLRRENFRRRVWYPAVRAAGMEGFRFHDLRHTNATLAAASGAPLPALMARLGHASAAAAIRYQHRIEGQDEEVAEYLEAFGGLVPTAKQHLLGN
ncbi:MAG TPA: site-specific integrase, partial [Chloroflexota bacterium]|nr:site-specific integrase [Chloroflexota bacterium]